MTTIGHWHFHKIFVQKQILVVELWRLCHHISCHCSLWLSYQQYGWYTRALIGESYQYELVKTIGVCQIIPRVSIRQVMRSYRTWPDLTGHTLYSCDYWQSNCTSKSFWNSWSMASSSFCCHFCQTPCPSNSSTLPPPSADCVDKKRKRLYA